MFSTPGPKAVRLSTPATANSLNFTAPGYTVTGTETLTLAEPALITGTADASIAVPVTGTAGLRREGTGNTVFTGPLSHTGLTALTSGTVTLAEGSSSTGNGNLVLADPTNSRAVLNIDGSGEYNFSGSVRVGRGDLSAAAIVQTEGTVTVGGTGVEYLQLGGGVTNPSGSYGAYVLSGGTLNTSGGGPSGIRVGDFGNGVLIQTGGVLNCARWFALGGNGGSLGDGVASFLGGEATVAAGYRILLGDRPNSTSVVNLGTLAGGDASVTTLNTTGLAVGANGSAASAELNLNAGVLTLGGPLFRAAGGAVTAVNANGATLRAGLPDISLLSDTLVQVNLYKAGLTIDTAGNNATAAAGIMAAEGSGVYPAGGAFAVANGGAGYLAPPLVTVFSSGGGYGITAIAEVANGAVTRVLITSPGQLNQAGDSLTFFFNGGGATTPAPEFVQPLAAADLAPNATGGLTKTGAGRLTVNANLSYTGATGILEGELESNGTIEGTSVTVAPGATLTGNIGGTAPVRVEGTLAPGSGLGHIELGGLTLAAGSTMAIDLGDWSQPGPGTGHDTATVASLAVQATSASKLRLSLDSTLLTNFSETARSLTLVTAASGITGLDSGNWQVEAPGFPGTGTWSLSASGSSLVLAYTPGGNGGGGYTSWTAGFPGLTDSAPGADPDRDGVSNLLEYALNGNPTQTNTDLLPAVTVTPAGFEFTFIRLRASASGTDQVFEYGSTLGDWTAVAIPTASGGNVTITPDTPAQGLDSVRVTLPASAAADGRLFGRLRVTSRN